MFKIFGDLEISYEPAELCCRTMRTNNWDLPIKEINRNKIKLVKKLIIFAINSNVWFNDDLIYKIKRQMQLQKNFVHIYKI